MTEESMWKLCASKNKPFYLKYLALDLREPSFLGLFVPFEV
jgi:hypothetical protein